RGCANGLRLLFLRGCWSLVVRVMAFFVLFSIAQVSYLELLEASPGSVRYSPRLTALMRGASRSFGTRQPRRMERNVQLAKPWVCPRYSSRLQPQSLHIASGQRK
ncbi:unnamed protein product, partial [Ectocarpus sp. 12 AP-2014]